MIRREENSFGEWFHEQMREIDANYKHELKMAALWFPLGFVVAWMILAL